MLISRRLRPQKVHVKEYGGYGDLYNFMLEEMEDYGPTNVAKFARFCSFVNFDLLRVMRLYILFSRDRQAVDILYTQLMLRIKKSATAVNHS